MQPDPPRLRMTSIERFHLLDDHPAWPNWIGSILDFDGEIDQEFARRAIDVVLSRHPLIASRVSVNPYGWEVDPSAKPVVRFFQCKEIGNQPLPDRPDINQSAGSMFIAQTDGRRTRIKLLIHHGLCDGLGGLQFVREWMQVYDALFHGQPETKGLGELSAATLINRNRLYLTSHKYLAHLWKQPIALFGAAKFVFRRFVILGDRATISPNETPKAADSGWPHMLSAEIDAANSGKVRRAANKAKVSMNDWLAGCLIEAVFSWLDKNGNDGGAKHIRLIVPISLRSAVDRTMPAANRTTLVQLDRCREDTQPRIRLMQGIAFELGLIRAWQLDRLFLIAMRVVGCSNLLMRRSARWHKYRATTLLTNLGKPLLRLGLGRDDDQCWKAGNLVLTSMDLVPPIKHGLPVSFAVHQYGKCLRISMQFDPAALSEAAAREILQGFSGRIESTEL